MNAKSSVGSAILLAFILGMAFSLWLPAQDEAYKLGYQAYMRGRYDEAIRIFNGVVEEYPEWHFGLYMLGKSYKGKEDYAQAIRILTRAIEYSDSPEDKFKTYYELADAYYRAKNYSRALQHIGDCKRLSNTDGYAKAKPQLVLIEGFSNFNLNRFQQVITIFKPLVDSGDASANVLKTVAKSYQELGQNSNAVSIIQRVVQKDPRDLVAHKILVKSFVNDAKWSNAIGSADYGLRNFDRDWELHYLKGLAHYKLRQYIPAINSLKQSLVIRPQDRVYKHLGDAYRDNREFLNATEAYNSAQRSYTNDPSFYTNFAFCWYQFVPRNTERFKGTQDEQKYKTALGNAIVLLNQAKTIQGANLGQIRDIEDGVNNKIERLDKGQFVEEQYEIFIDPETGEVVKRKVGEGGDN